MSLKSALSTGLWALLVSCPNWAADTIYKCGNHYSQTPCPSGKALSIDDSRLPEQKKQQDALTRRDAELANEMEKTRLADELALREADSKRQTAAKPRRPVAAVDSPQRVSPKLTKQVRRKPQDFTAVVPGSQHKPAKTPKPRKKTAADPK